MTRLNRWLLVLLGVQLTALLAIWLVPRRTPAERPRKILEGKIDPSAVSRLCITGNDGKRVELARREGGWVLASDGDYPVQSNKVTEFLGKLPSLAAGSPVTSKSAHHRALEVASDTFQRDIRIEQPGKPELRFYLGSSAGLKDVHLRLAGENVVYLVKDLSAWDAGTLPADWVDTEYFKVERNDIVGLSLENAEGKIELQKDGDKWTLAEQAEGTKLKDSEVDSLLASASSVALQEPVGRKQEPAHGLDKPAATLTVLIKPASKKPDSKAEGKGGGSKAEPGVPAGKRLFIGAKVGDAYYAKSETSPYVVKLASWAAETFLKKKKSDFEEKEKKEGDKEKDKGKKDDGEEPADHHSHEGE